MKSRSTTLQISLAPSDYAHAVHLLPHQVATWGLQVTEILLTIDFHRSPGRFSARWEEGAHRILPLARSVAGARVLEVDYSAAARQRTADEFFDGLPVPLKDFRGGPSYSYFFALNAASHDDVLHVDSDLFFGGGSQTWISEALSRLDEQSETLIVAPLSGPPHPHGLRYLRGIAEPGESQAYRFAEMSSRVFLIRRSRFRERVGHLRAAPPNIKQRLIARLEGNPPADLPEHLFSRAMQRNGLVRREFLGRSPGMWSLHPPYRTADFYRQLPQLIRRVESGDMPEEQRGDHDINDSLVDWSTARDQLRRNRIWRRLWTKWTTRDRKSAR